MSQLDQTQTAATSPTERAIDQALSQGRAALIGYLPVGFPSLAASIEAAESLIDQGVDIIELGLPYSDPVMDGPVIQEAVAAALEAGFRVDHCFEAVEKLSTKSAPVLVMTYYNPVLRRGLDRFAAELAAAGGAGTIIPDLVPDEAANWIAQAKAHQLDRVFLVAPASDNERLTQAARACRGFTYATSTMGVTGTRATLSRRAAQLVGRARAAGAARVCVGVGVSSAAQAAEVASFADGVIVGSALVNALAGPGGLAQMAALAGELAQAVRR
ncbi:MAG: tryptophan synthase subunit alpha [Micrococcales bacterium]|nr:tryptophan synthase subunit alpha [Micrococcales bacterium]